MSPAAATLLSPRAHNVRLDRHIQAAERDRSTFLHATWIVLAITWGIGWPACQWLTRQHAAIDGIEPPLVHLATLAPEFEPSEFMRLDATPRLRQGIEFTPSAASAKGPQYYVPMTAGPRDNGDVRFVASGLPPRLLDSKGTTPLLPPYAVRWVEAGVPAAVRKEMARRGTRFAEPVHLVTFVELSSEGRVVNPHAHTDPLIQSVVTAVGSALGGAALLMWWVGGWRVKRLRSQRLPLPQPM